MILVTGGTGFLGAYILQELVSKGLPVRALYRTKARPFFIPATVWDQVEWVQGEVLDVVSLAEAMEGVKEVIHAAAIVSFHNRDRRQMMKVNVEGTANVVNAALEAGVERFIHVSSVAALGRTAKSELVTEARKWEPNRQNTQYAISKYGAEVEVWRGFAEGLPGAILNPSTILGFGDWHRSSCALFRNAWRGFSWYTEGTNGFVGVEDVARAAVALLRSDIVEERFIVNAGNWTFRRLLDTLADNFGQERPHRKATPFLGAFAWRMEALKAMLSDGRPLLTRESAMVAHARTEFDGSALQRALPGFTYASLEDVIQKSCEKYKAAVAEGKLSP